jgi:hypothetical protein
MAKMVVVFRDCRRVQLTMQVVCKCLRRRFHERGVDNTVHVAIHLLRKGDNNTLTFCKHSLPIL